MLYSEPVTLKGNYVTLRPSRIEDAPLLAEAVKDGELWKIWSARVPSPENTEADLNNRLAEMGRGLRNCFTVSLLSGEVVGSTNFMNMSAKDQRLEIGATWYAARAQRTPVNTECKYLLLRHAFETLGVRRVALRAHSRNYRSRRAIERIGGVFEGVLRQYDIQPNGTIRDVAVYSILRPEWPAVGSWLEAVLDRR